MKQIEIVNPNKLRDKVESLKNRSDDIKSRMSQTLKALWFPERTLTEINTEINFDLINYAFPHFEDVTKFIKNRILISQKLKSHFQSPPILLIGEPGLGKTFYAKKIAKLLNIPTFEINMATLTASFELSGSSLQWGESTVGFIANSLATSKVANPIFVVDEIDKVSGSNRFNPLNVFYCLLEKHTARQYMDEALGIEMDASHIVWILTANEFADIKGPILSRMKVFNIKQPTKEKMYGIISCICESLIEENGFDLLISKEISKEITDHLSSLTPREIRRALEEAINKAIVEDRNTILIHDIPKQTELEINRVGFI